MSQIAAPNAPHAPPLKPMPPARPAAMTVCWSDAPIVCANSAAQLTGGAGASSMTVGKRRRLSHCVPPGHSLQSC